MTTPLALTVVLQAALLLGAAVQLSNVFLQPRKAWHLLSGAVGLGLALALARHGAPSDPQRFLCGPGDCLALALSVAGVRFLAVKKEHERLVEERELTLRFAAEEAEKEQRVWAEEQLKAAAAALEKKTGVAAAGAVAAPAASLLSGGARATRPAQPLRR